MCKAMMAEFHVVLSISRKKKSCNSCFYYVILIFVPRVMHSLYAIWGRRVEFKSAEVVWIAKTSFLVPAGWCAKLWKAGCLLVVCCLLPVNIWKVHKSAVPLSCNLNEYCNVGCRGKLWWHGGRGQQMVGWLQSSHFGGSDVLVQYTVCCRASVLVTVTRDKRNPISTSWILPCNGQPSHQSFSQLDNDMIDYVV